MLPVLTALVAGCDASAFLRAYPAAVLSNLISGLSQGGLADPAGLMSHALLNGLWNILGLLASP